MPARSFKVDVANESSYLILKNVGHNACSGGWTDGWGTPPSSIPAGESIGFQGESDAVFGGTEAWVKFAVIDNGGNNQGQLYIYWDNPYYGATQCKVIPALKDVPPDCGADNASTFNTGAAPPTGFNTTRTNITDLDGQSNSPGFDTPAGSAVSVAALGLGGITGVANLFGTQGIVAHAHVAVTIQGSESQTYSFSTTSYTYAPAPHPLVTDWVGHWATGGVDIQITRLSGDTVTIVIHDAGSTPEVSMTATVDIENHPIVYLKKQSIKTLAGVGDKLDESQIHPLSDATAKALSATSLPASRGKLVSNIKATISNDPAVRKAAVSPTVINGLAANIAYTLSAVGTIRLDNGVALTLMQSYANGSPSAKTVRYQRFGVAGTSDRDVEVSKYMPPPR